MIMCIWYILLIIITIVCFIIGIAVGLVGSFGMGVLLLLIGLGTWIIWLCKFS